MRSYDWSTIVAIAATAILASVAPALAITVGVPGPIAGVGLPALALVGGAMWLGRKIRNRKLAR
jgi:uncharacterized membrane protein